MKIFSQLKQHYAEKWTEANGRELHLWWPVSGKFKPQELEIVVGTILTQNTNWKNVEKALANMIEAGFVSADTISRCSTRKLGHVIRPAGFFTQKAKRLKELAAFIVHFDDDFYKNVTRQQLLNINGIGQETADSILLYACGKAEFVVDAYTKRIFARFGILGKDEKYDNIKRFFEACIRKDTKLYKEFHALIVEHAKETCRKKPLCDACPLKECKRFIE
ncbi:MAG: endonuclease [Candidatus Aenigmarchaeota archaeon]|nr:endonuclease [Candidatus Aenigmarchaeota archaeon]